jgi:hypothetical protein
MVSIPARRIDSHRVGCSPNVLSIGFNPFLPEELKPIFVDSNADREYFPTTFSGGSSQTFVAHARRATSMLGELLLLISWRGPTRGVLSHALLRRLVGGGLRVRHSSATSTSPSSD